MNCPFCKINKEKTRIIKEGEYTFVILSNPKLMEGHILVIPKRHVEKLSELKSGEKKELLDTIIDFQEKILDKIAKGCDIRQNYRPFQKQSNLKVNHLHFHLQPRKFKDELYNKCQIHEGPVFKKLNKKEISRIVKKLK